MVAAHAALLSTLHHTSIYPTTSMITMVLHKYSVHLPGCCIALWRILWLTYCFFFFRGLKQLQLPSFVISRLSRAGLEDWTGRAGSPSNRHQAYAGWQCCLHSWMLGGFCWQGDVARVQRLWTKILSTFFVINPNVKLQHRWLKPP